MGCLSELPDEIIHHICSPPNLNNKEAIRLSLSSKELWRSVRTRPALYFHGQDKEIRGEVEYMIATLNRYHKDNINLVSFKFHHSHLNLCSEDLECIKLAAAKKGLRNLDLWWSRKLPASVFQAQSLVRLSLYTCDLQGNWVCDLRNLKRLKLFGVGLADGEMFENIIRCSPSIEFLKILSCCPDLLDFNFKIFNLRKLKKLKIYLVSTRQTVEVINPSPNLEALAFGYLHSAEGTFRRNFPEPKYQTLTSLYLTGNMRMDDNFFDKLPPKLEDLRIIRNHTLRRINISNPSLKRIQVKDNRELQEARFDVPSIALFEYENCCDAIVPKLSFKGNNSKGKWISRIKFIGYFSMTNTLLWFIELNKFLIALNGSETFLTVGTNNVGFDQLEEARMMMNSFKIPSLIA